MAVVNAVVKRNGKILTIKRHKEPWIGMYALPGGHIEKGEDGPAALIREAREETGYEIATSEEDYKGIGMFVYGDKNFEVACYEAKIVGGKEARQKEEIDEIKWMGIKEFAENLKKHSFPEDGVELILKFVK